MSESLRVLVVEDSENDALLLLRALKAGDYNVHLQRVQTADNMLLALQAEPWDIIFSDYAMPGFDAIGALAVLRQSKIDIPFVIVSGTIGEETAVAGIRAGAKDYLIKGKLLRLIPVVQRELRDARDRKAKSEMKLELQDKNEQLLQSQKMEAIGSLAGGVAHDFNNILAVILLEAERGLDCISEKSGENADELHRGFAQIKKAAERAAGLTRQLLAFSRKQVLQPRVLNPNDVVSGMENMLLRLIEASITMKFELGKTVENIKVDQGHYEQIVINLAVNSRDAMPAGGTLKISTETLSLTAEMAVEMGAAPGLYTVLKVADSGEGMSAATKSRIFDPFFTTKAVGKGTGLGLSTVYGIVKQNGGYICVESEIGKGTTFWVYFPQVKEPVLASVTKLVSRNNLRGTETILVAEDDPDLRDLACLILESHNYTVLTASNGREALEMVQTHDKPIHLVITDVVMPHMGGQELCEKANLLQPDLKFLFFSGYTDDVLVQQGVNAGLVSFLEKPCSMQDLLGKVREILDFEKARDEKVALQATS